MAPRLIVECWQINGVAQLPHQFRFRFDFTTRWTVRSTRAKWWLSVCVLFFYYRYLVFFFFRLLLLAFLVTRAITNDFKEKVKWKCIGILCTHRTNVFGWKIFLCLLKWHLIWIFGFSFGQWMKIQKKIEFKFECENQDGIFVQPMILLNFFLWSKTNECFFVFRFSSYFLDRENWNGEDSAILPVIVNVDFARRQARLSHHFFALPSLWQCIAVGLLSFDCDIHFLSSRILTLFSLFEFYFQFNWTALPSKRFRTLIMKKKNENKRKRLLISSAQSQTRNVFFFSFQMPFFFDSSCVDCVYVWV